MPPRRGMVLTFEVHGRFRLEIVREAGDWIAFAISAGRRRRLAEVVIPAELPAEAIGGYLDDLFHELAQPGTSVTGGPKPARRSSSLEGSRAPWSPGRARSGRTDPATGGASSARRRR